MTGLLLVSAGFFAVYAIYIATVCARHFQRPEDFLDAGGALPGWAFVFAAPGVVLASLGLRDHLLTTALYGLQYNHLALGAVVVALCGVAMQKRLTLASAICGIRSPIELLGAYFGSQSLRIYLLVVLFLFGLALSGYSVAAIGDIVALASGGAFSSAEVVWVCMFFLFLGPVIGGWRGTIYIVAAQSVLVLALLVFCGVFSVAAIDGLASFTSGIATPKAMRADQIPGVIQYVRGFGKDDSVGGFMTTTAVLSTALSLIGIVLSPAYSLFGMTSRVRTGFAFGQVWMTAGLLAGALLLVTPILSGVIAHVAGTQLTAENVSVKGIVDAFAARDSLAALCLLLLLLTSLQTAVVFFTSAAANIFTLDVVARYALPDLDPKGRRLASRIALAFLFLATALLASFAPRAAAVLSPLALSLSAQLLPAFLGLCWVPWISRSAVITGLIFGILLVFFTEPPGLIVAERLFGDLPWGRWPLTIHSAGWGLAFNLSACLLVSIFTRNDRERASRQRLHEVFAADHRAAFGGRAARSAKWSLPLIWAFFAIGPGAILGNDFFAHPIFTEGDAKLGVSSLWIWQVAFWLLGVFIVWWLAYQGRMSMVPPEVRSKIRLDDSRDTLGRRRPPRWIGLLLARLAER